MIIIMMMLSIRLTSTTANNGVSGIASVCAYGVN